MRFIPRSFVPVALSVGVMLIAFASGILQPLENAFLDARSGWFNRTPVNDVVIVEIDERTLHVLGRWPWSRSIHAELIDRLNEAQPRAAFYDVDFSARSGEPAADDAVATALSKRAYPIVLPAFRQAGGAGGAGGDAVVVTRPLPEFERSASIGLVDVTPTTDGLVRGIVHADEIGGVAYRSAVSQLAGRRGYAAATEYPIDFGISPAAFKHVSYVDVLDGDIAMLAGKTVFVGATAPELGDSVPVPVRGSLPGVVTQATAYATLLAGSPTRVSLWLSVGLAVCVCFGIPSLRRMSWRRTALIALAAIAGVLVFAVLLDLVVRMRLDVMPVVFATLLSAAVGSALSSDREGLRAILAGARLKRNEALISSVLSASSDGIIVFSRDGVVQDANAASAMLLGRALASLYGENVGRLLPGIFEIETLDAQVSSGSKNAGGRYELTVGVDESPVPVEVSITRATVGRQVWFAAILRDATERKRQQALLKHQATHDVLTGLPNRVLLSRALENLNGSRRTALFMLDLDRFKDVNDALGHATGDTVLTILGQRLRGALSERNLIARIGGDEFAVVIPDYTDITELRLLADNLLERVRAPINTNSNTVEVGGSIGIALCPEHGTDGAALLQRADVAMYVAKNNHTNVEFYSERTDQSSIRHVKMTSALRAAIANDELELHYQPKVRLHDLKCVGVEALARWTHEEFGEVSPAEFVTLAEESDLIVPLTRWAVTRALEDCATWRAAGFDVDLAMNLSARHLRDPAFAEELLAIIDRHNDDPRRLEFEVTETALMSDPEKAVAVLRVLTRAGVRISIDDFGTGYSSLAYLKHLDLHALKIDRSFVKNITANTNDLTIVRSTLRMAHSLGLSVVADGIEERSHYELLRELGCAAGQGHWIARSMAAEQLLAWSRAWDLGRPLQLSFDRQAAG